MNLSQSEILEALAAAQERPVAPDDAFTMADIARAVGKCQAVVAKELHALKAKGGLEVVKVAREDLAGRMVARPAYRFLSSRKAKK